MFLSLYLGDGPVSRSGFADGTRSFAMFLLLCFLGTGTGLGCGVVSVVSVLLISLLCSRPSSLFFMILYSIYMLHDRSRLSTKTCAECHTCSLVGYGGGILDDISILTSL